MTARTIVRSLARPGLLAACLVAAALAGCTPYDPDLGNTPYLCAAQEPRCPDHYECVDTSARPVCVLAGSLPPDAGIDAPSGFQCAMDGMLEPNDALNQAYQTDVGPGAPQRVFGPLSICPEGDKDHFQINITTANRGIEVITRWDSGMPISSSILNGAGIAIANGSPLGSNAIRACATNLPTGIFYAIALSPKSLQNNYRIELRIVDNCL
jgi:hypothetical protein